MCTLCYINKLKKEDGMRQWPKRPLPRRCLGCTEVEDRLKIAARVLRKAATIVRRSIDRRRRRQRGWAGTVKRTRRADNLAARMKARQAGKEAGRAILEAGGTHEEAAIVDATVTAEGLAAIGAAREAGRAAKLAAVKCGASMVRQSARCSA